MIAMIDKSGNRAGARNVLGLLLALWVSLAVQPCAVAAVAEHDCPHCPTEIEAAPGAHHHRGHTASEESAAMPTDCGAMQAECCEIDDRIVGVRTDAPDIDDDDTVLATGAAPPGAVDAPRAQPELAVPLPQPAGRSVPLHIINCVFLI
jgi:hypothetical protein